MVERIVVVVFLCCVFLSLYFVLVSSITRNKYLSAEKKAYQTYKTMIKVYKLFKKHKWEEAHSDRVKKLIYLYRELFNQIKAKSIKNKIIDKDVQVICIKYGEKIDELLSLHYFLIEDKVKFGEEIALNRSIVILQAFLTDIDRKYNKEELVVA